jgi:hypothetical protein
MVVAVCVEVPTPLDRFGSVALCDMHQRELPSSRAQTHNQFFLGCFV